MTLHLKIKNKSDYGEPNLPQKSRLIHLQTKRLLIYRIAPQNWGATK